MHLFFVYPSGRPSVVARDMTVWTMDEGDDVAYARSATFYDTTLVRQRS
jgi:hypothetical protein